MSAIAHRETTHVLSVLCLMVANTRYICSGTCSDSFSVPLILGFRCASQCILSNSRLEAHDLVPTVRRDAPILCPRLFKFQRGRLRLYRHTGAGGHSSTRGRITPRGRSISPAVGKSSQLYTSRTLNGPLTRRTVAAHRCADFRRVCRGQCLFPQPRVGAVRDRS